MRTHLFTSLFPLPSTSFLAAAAHTDSICTAYTLSPCATHYPSTTLPASAQVRQGERRPSANLRVLKVEV